MKRKKPLRRTPLNRGKSELKRTPLKNKGGSLKRTRMKKKKPKVNKNFPDEWKTILIEVHNGLCECCFQTFDEVHPHHRKFKSQGGTPDLANAAYLCKRCHTETHNPSTREWKFKTMAYRTPRHAEIGESELDFPEIYGPGGVRDVTKPKPTEPEQGPDHGGDAGGP